MSQKKTPADADAMTTSGAEPAAQPGSHAAKASSQPKAATKKPATARPRSLIYIGPNLPRGKLHNGTAFRGGRFPAHVDALIEECPALKFLMVAPDRLATARKDLGDKSTVVASKYAAAHKHFYKGAS